MSYKDPDQNAYGAAKHRSKRQGPRRSNDTFVFDEQEHQSIRGEEKPNLLLRLKAFLTSRYAILTLILMLTGALIFYETASLQLNPTASEGLSETSGVPRQRTILAPRGDITDVSGRPLAWSVSTRKLFLSYAGLDSSALNEMLLDLALYLESEGVEWESSLSEFIDLELPSYPGQAAGGGLVPVWQLSRDEVLIWQTNRNLFNLSEPQEGTAVTFDDRQAKEDPNLFYDYLLYQLFKIEDPAADGRRYRQADAWRIMQLRYLIYENNWSFINGTPVELARNVPESVIHVINEQNFRFMGVISGTESERVYDPMTRQLSHVIGYVGRISARQYEDLRDIGYSPDSVVGQAGVESSAERYLAGRDGVQPYNIWSVAGEAGAFYPETIGREPQPGNHVRLTIDLRLQQVALDSLERAIQTIRDNPDAENFQDADAGAVMMLDVNTGAVLAMASTPGYDPADFLTQAWDEEAADRVQTYLTDNVNKPMMNRAMMEIYAPGSTFKPVTAIAGLESGAISIYNNAFRCVGHEDIGGRIWYCLERPNSGHGLLNLVNGMATSCNMYFYHLGTETGIDQISSWAKQLGLGEYSGIDLPGEARGIRSSRETMRQVVNNPDHTVWQIADTAQSSIGQLYNSYTITQLAVYTAAVATGQRVTPHVIADITRPDGSVLLEKSPDAVDLGISPESLDLVRRAMVAVAHSNEGTASRMFADFPITIAAKTGTAETGFEDVSSSNGLFICYAPAENPQVAIAQIIERGRWGSNTLSVARDLLTAYFRLDETDEASAPVVRPGLTDFAAETPDGGDSGQDVP
ncbi:MAG: penicillin-binding transpeptidase domain-containing protein [Eubacteriales bacterium]|nr:penicillin-binding transpeptidase domain-containing protein [Eubacteriales bacterium]